MSVPTHQTDDVPISGSVQLRPEPRSLEALGRHHTFSAAVAELVDNSIDAGARNIRIRFVRSGSRLARLFVADDGSGMNDERIDVAMTVGGDRSYSDGEIGRFGLGLKAASFSQARSVTVISAVAGAAAIGRRWQVTHAKRDYRCEIVESGYATEQLAQDWGFPGASSGTVVRWDDVRGFPTVADEETVDHFLHETITKVRTHLGLIFHRILDTTGLSLVIDVEDQGEVLLHTEIPPLNPFGYNRSGAPGWPKELIVEDEHGQLCLSCHIWPGRSTLEQFRLDGDVIQRQGLYVYYNGRIVQCGGWNNLRHADKQLSLARIAVDIDGDVEQLLTLKPEKNGVEVGPAFGSAVRRARAADGSTFDDYIECARGVLKEANRRRRDRQAIVPPGTGLSPRVRQAFSREVPLKEEDAIEIRWVDFYDDDFFEIDRKEGVLWLNSRYRRALTGGRRGSLNDLPLIKTLMFLLVENIYAGQMLGSRDKDNIELWQAVLTAAAKEELY
jgi:hypothetical protein